MLKPVVLGAACACLVVGTTAALAQSATLRPRPGGQTLGMRPAPTGLACRKQRDRALVTNNTNHTLPAGTYLEVHATGATQEAEGTGSMQLSEPLAPGQTYTSAIRFSDNFTTCTARVSG